MEAKRVTHTEGPWVLEIYDNGSMSIVPMQGFGVARVNYESGQPAKANGMLLAAAPDLLAACELALRNWTNISGGYRPVISAESEAVIRAAIRKARGE